jgi:hypothetical protein
VQKDEIGGIARHIGGGGRSHGGRSSFFAVAGSSAPASHRGGKRRTRAAARQVSCSHSDNGRLSTPWQEVIFHLTVVDPSFEPSSPARVYGPKLAAR